MTEWGKENESIIVQAVKKVHEVSRELKSCDAERHVKLEVMEGLLGPCVVSKNKRVQAQGFRLSE